MKQRKWFCVISLLLLICCLAGCSKHSVVAEVELETSKTSEKAEISTNEDIATETEKPSVVGIMDRISMANGFEKAIAYENKIEGTMLEDVVVLLCTSESGKYEAYGIVSPEYGMNGIVLNNIIDGESNHNYLEEEWAYGGNKPTLTEQGEYAVIFSFTQEREGIEEIREIYFDTYDTGTMTENNEVKGKE